MPSDRSRPSLFSRIFYVWVGPLLTLGRTRALTAADMPALPPRIDPQYQVPGFADLPLAQPWAMLWHIFRSMPLLLTAQAVLMGACAIANIAAPLCLHRLLELLAIDGKALPVGPALLAAAGLCVASIVDAIAFQHYIYWAVCSTQRAVNGLNRRLYRHALRLSRSTRLKFPVGDVVNYMGTDSDAVGEFSKTIVEIGYSLAVLIGVLICLYRLLGPTAIAAVAALAVLSPGTSWLGKRFIALNSLSLGHRDERVSQISQVLSGIRIVKFFAWRDKILDEIRQIRAAEVNARRRLAILRSVSVIFDIGPATLVSVVTFATYVALGHKLDAATVFASLSLLSQLEFPFSNLTGFISTLTEARVSAARVGAFLQEEVLPEDERPLAPPFSATGLQLRKVAARYGDSPIDTLSEVTLTIAPGEAVAIVGPVGAGKSTLLLTLLGEAPLRTGELSFHGIGAGLAPRTAFVPQEAFVLNGSLIDNILFGEPAAGLAAAVTACALDFDIARLPGGLHTELGEHGVNLSGGQKQRLCLARAVMARPGLALLDDPLAAVDVRTEAHLVDQVIFGALAATTRLIVTHRLQHLARFDRVLFLDQGRLAGNGTFAELLAGNARFARFVAETLHEKHGETPTAAPDAAVAATEPMRITEDEDRATGAVSKSIYFDYMRAMGGEKPGKRGLILAGLIASLLVVTVLPILQTSWLSVWTDGPRAATTGARSAPMSSWLRPLLGSDKHNILIYGAIGALLLLVFFGQNLFWSLRAVVAGRILHDQCLKAVLSTNLRFFDSTPIGRILNRFSRDVDSVEHQLPWAFEGTVRAVFGTIGTTVVLLMIMPWIIVLVAPVLLVFFRIQGTYRASSREAQRLSSIANSPRFAHFKESLHGLTVIRGFHKSELFIASYQAKLGEYQRMFHAMICFNRWFSLRVPLISAVVALGASASIVFSARTGLIAAGTTGMMLTYALRFWGRLNWSVRSFSDVEARMTSVERLRYYASLPAEIETRATPVLAETEIWPTHGLVELRHVYARYAEHLPDVVHDLSLTIPAGARVGLIGRTGSGKSTVFQLLFRFLAVRDGAILIDGVDIARVPLGRLRRALAIIPQDPTLFRGRLRDNLDRFSQHTDAALWQALERVHLRDFVATLPGGLAAEVKENGNNFSQGQRQLFCLARALLTNAQIIVMDEATASVDVETDVLIQRAIREECVGRTLIIIAHRPWTVQDCDWIFELEDGRLKSAVQGADSCCFLA